MTNRANGVLYVGVTNNLARRIYEHKHGMIEGFTKRYNLHQLVYYEAFDDIGTAIAREKILKKYLRYEKIALIESMNKEWSDLAETILT